MSAQETFSATCVLRKNLPRDAVGVGRESRAAAAEAESRNLNLPPTMPDAPPPAPATTRDPLKPLRLTKVLRQLLAERYKSSIHALQGAIASSNEGTAAAASISRRKLQQLLEEPEQVSLSLAQLNALHNFLQGSNLGEGLDEKPLFDRLGVLSRVAECGQVAFLIGAYPRPPKRHNDVSLWDARCVARLVQEIGQLRPGTSFTIQDVLWNKNVSALYGSTAELIERLDRQGCSIISIGSPRACIGSEALLSLMLDVSPMTKPGPGLNEPPEVPFSFVWPPKLARGFQSSFALTGKDLRGRGHEAVGRRVQHGRSTAFLYGNEVVEIPHDAEGWTMAGIIVAQRRRHGNVLVVVAGNSGPSTLAAALELARLSAVLPFKSGAEGSVLWAPVRADVGLDRSPDNVGDRRDLKDSGLLAEADTWPKPLQAPDAARPA